MPYDYLLNSVRKRKRFSKWLKRELPDELDFIKEYYGYSDKKAREAYEILGSDGVNTLKKRYNKGG